MPQSILKLGDEYFIWSTVVDAPVTYGMTLDELADHVREEHGRAGLAELPERLSQVEATGCSVRGVTAAGMIDGNRAGPNETELDQAGILAAYGRNRKEPTP